MRKMLKHIGMPIAVASIAAIMALAWMMIIDPDLVAGQGSQSARAHITVQIGSGDDTVSWYDPDGCTSKYNLYLYVNTPVPGSSTGQTTRTHLGSAPSGSTQATLPISHGGGSPFLTPRVKVDLYCGEYDSSSSQNDLVATTSLSVGGSGLRFGTFSSAPLTALSVSSATLSPSFNRGLVSYRAAVPSDERRVTVSATGLTGYQVVYLRNPRTVVTFGGGLGECSYSYGNSTTVLSDSDPDASGFQIDLSGGQNQLGIALHKGDECAGITIYELTVAVESVPATGRPAISGTAQVGQTLTASTSGISDEDGLDDVSFSYQWTRVHGSTETSINGATSVTYRISKADVDKTIKVRVTFTDDAGNQESLSSAPTPAVTEAEAKSTNATLKVLTLSGVNFGTFASSTTTYTARVSNTVSQTTVTPTLNDSDASYIIKIGGGSDDDGVISLSVGSNVITVEVTAEDGETTKTYTITVTRLNSQSDPISTDATLSGLTLSGISFGTFVSETTSYTASVANSVRNTTVTPTVNHSGSSYVIKLDGVTDSDGALSLAVGSNVITVEVTAEDTTTTKTYSVTVTRADPPSTDATLKLLKINSTVFRIHPLQGDTSHGVSFGYSVTEATITATTNHSAASYVIKVDGEVDDDGVVSLVQGSNPSITVVVTAEDGTTTKTYNVFLFRQAPSNDAKLKALTLSGLSIGTFAWDTLSYTASVANTVSQTAVTPTLNDSDASYVIKLGGVTDADGTVLLAVGSNVITVEVTAEDDSTTQTYTVTVTRAASTTPEQPSSDASLRSLTLSGVDFGTFASGTTSYSAQVANIVSQTTVTPTVNDSDASHVIKLGGVTDTDGVISLSVGSNVITVEVTAEDTTTTTTYTVTVTRAAPLSSDATLKSLSLGDDISIGTFSTVTTSYSVQVANSVTETTVTPTLNHSGASYVIKLGGVTDSDGVIPLGVGKNVITVEVTAEDGQATRTYTVTVTRAEPPSTDATLKGLVLSRVDFGTFSSATTSYTAQVVNSVSQTTVSPTVNDSGASYVIMLGGVTDADGTISLAVGNSVITVVVTAEDGKTTSTYTVTVTRAEPPTPEKSSDATLSALTLSGIDFGTFDSTTGSYSASVANSVSQTTVAPTVNDSGASYVIKLGGVTDADGTISLAVGSNAVTIEVTAEDDETTKTYTVTVTRSAPPSTDAALSALTLSGINFGTFASGTNSYTARAANNVSRTTVTPTVNHSGASYVIKLGGVTDADGTVSLAVGSNVITVEVTAEDTTTTQKYSVIGYASSTALFGRHAEGPKPDRHQSWRVQVGHDVIQRTGCQQRDRDNRHTVREPLRSEVIKLGGVTDSDGTVSLAVGRNVITVEVTAEDGNTTQTYTVNVTRADPPSIDATLSALTLSDIDFGTFASDTTSYSADVGNDVSQTTVTPIVNDSGASYVIKLEGVTDADGSVALSVGKNVITVEVTAEDNSTTKTYTVTVTRGEPPSTDATLSALILSGIDFGTFDSTTTSYSASVVNSVSQTTVTPTVNDSGASYVIKLGGVTDSDGTISLAVGSNVITIEVTAEDRDTNQTYTVTVTRAAPPSTDATLSALTLSDVDFGTFASGTTSYTATVPNGVSQTTVTPTVNDSGASYVIKLGGVTDADGTISLAVGNSVITVVVTAEDGKTTSTYTVTVTRAEPPTPEKSSDATLSALTLSGIDFGTFDSTTGSYSASVANSVSQTTVAPTVNDSGASYVIKLGGVTDADGTISLAVGSNAVTIEVTAEDDETTKTYTVTVTRSAPPSTDAALSALTLSGINFGTFASGTNSYTARAANNVSRTTVTPTVNHSGASYVIKLGGVTDADGTVSLSVGSNVITVMVTAQDRQTTRTYTVTVTRAEPLSSDATLRALAFSGVDFGTFDSSTITYRAQVANGVSRTTVTPTVSSTGASYVIKLGGVTDADGTVSLSVGSNVITIVVTAQDGTTTQTYTVTVTRASQDEQPPRSDAPVTGELPTDVPTVNFRVSGFAHDRVDIAWAVPQNRSITKYVVQRYEHDGSGFVSSGSGEGSRFEDTTSDGKQHSLRNTHVRPDTLYQYVLSLKNDSGTTIIESSTTVRTLSSDATLSALTLTDIDLGTFDSETTSYTVDAANDVSQTTVTPTLNHTGASFVIKVKRMEWRTQMATLLLEVGENVITVEVTAEDGETALTYTVTITRKEISLLTGELASDDPPVNFRITSYDNSQVSLHWEIPNNRGITGYVLERYDHDGTEFVSSDWRVSGTVAGGDSATESSADLTSDTLYRYDLVLTSSAGTTIIEKSVEVRTREAGATALSADATLSALSLSGVELDTDFISSTNRYAGSVANNVTQTTVTATLSDSAASYVVKLGGAVDADGAVDLTPGRNVITVHVTAEDGVTTRIYTVVVTRAKTADALSSDASLRSLSLSGIDFGTFDPDTTTYTAQVINDVTQTTVTPVRNDVEAAHVIKLGGVGDSNGDVSLAVGENVITVEVTAEDGETTRTYTVTVTRDGAAAPDPEPDPTPADTCVQSVGADGAIEGFWDDTCLSEKDAPGGAGDRYARFFTLTLTEATDIVINLSSDEDTYLYLLEGHGKDGNTLHSNDDIAGGGVNLNSKLSVTLQPGSYTIEATTYRPETTGGLSLTIEGLGQAEETTPEPEPEPTPEVDTCVEPVDGDGTTEGSWDDTCLSDRAALSGTGDRYARFYTFTLTEATEIVIDLSSEEDTYLYLLDGHGKGGDTLHSNDDIASGGVNLNSRLSVTLQAGDYTIEATTYSPATSGDFTLTIAGLSQAEAPAPDPQPEPAPDPEPEFDACVEFVDADGTIEGSWDDSCLSDKAALSGAGERYARFYTFTLDENADVTITLESDEDTYLYVLEGQGKNGETLHTNDDIVYGVNTNSRLSVNLDAGDYTIEASTYYAQRDGDFNLTIEGLVTPP